MDSVHALKAKIIRDMSAESSKKQQPRQSLAIGSANRGRPTGLMKMNMGRFDAGAVSGTPVKSVPRAGASIKEENITSKAGSSRVTFKGPKNDEPSRKKRACEFQLIVVDCCVLFCRQVYVRESFRT